MTGEARSRDEERGRVYARRSFGRLGCFGGVAMKRGTLPRGPSWPVASC